MIRSNAKAVAQRMGRHQKAIDDALGEVRRYHAVAAVNRIARRSNLDTGRASNSPLASTTGAEANLPEGSYTRPGQGFGERQIPVWSVGRLQKLVVTWVAKSSRGFPYTSVLEARYRTMANAIEHARRLTVNATSRIFERARRRNGIR